MNDGIKKSKYNYVIWLDADFQHPPIYIKNFIKESFSSDVIVCSRFLQKSKRYFDIDKKFKEKNENQSILFNYICQVLPIIVILLLNMLCLLLLHY